MLVSKAKNKWHMCVDFTNFNVVYPNNPYPMPNIDRLIDKSLVYDMLRFMDSYSGNNQIQMDLLIAPKTTFMLNHANYY